jgi:hypothetical protein
MLSYKVKENWYHEKLSNSQSSETG